MPMPQQVQNPLKFRCAPNAATPDYVAYYDFEMFVAYGLLECWLSCDGDDPNADCCFPRPWDRDDVRELREIFLDTLEMAIAFCWTGEVEPGSGDQESANRCVIAHAEGEELGQDEVALGWYVSFRDDAMMFELYCTDSDPTMIWLAYEALADRRAVVEVLKKAEATIGRESWERLDELSQEISP